MSDFQVITRLPSGVTEVDAYLGGARVISTPVGPPGAPGSPGSPGVNTPPTGPDFRFATSASTAVSWLNPFTVPGGMVTVVSPEQYGAVGDGTTNDGPAIQSAIDACAAAGFGIVWLQKHAYLTNQKIVLKVGVQMWGQREHRDLLVQTGSSIVAGSSLTTGWVVETQSGTNSGFGISGINVVGRGAGMTTLLGGIHLVDGTYNCTIQHVGVSGVSNSAVGMSGHPTACRVSNCILGMDSSGVTLTAPVGTLHLTGTDHTILDNEIARGPSDTGGLSGYKKVTYTGFWRCAIYVGCASSWINGNVGEFGDCAYYVDSGSNTFVGPRADYSAGHGYYLTANAVGNTFTGARVFDAGIYSQYGGTATTYDGVYHAAGSARNHWVGLDFFNTTGVPVARYAWSDFSTGNKARDANTLRGISCDPVGVVGDIHYQASGMGQVLHDTKKGALVNRPPSRESDYWYDTDRGMPTFSDGTWWRDAAGAVVGNVANARRFNGQGGDNTIAWQVFGSSCTVAKGVYFLGTTAGQLLQRQNYAILTATATAHTNGYLETNQNSPAGDPTLPAVIPGHTYTVAVRTTAETVARAVTIRCRWRNSAGTNIQDDTAAITAGGTNSTSAVVTSYLQGCVAPATAAYLDVIVRIGAAASGMPTGEVHNLHDLTIIPGTATGVSAP